MQFLGGEAHFVHNLLKFCRYPDEKSGGGNKTRQALAVCEGLSRFISFKLAGVQGFEPQLADPESAVLPLNDTPISFVRSMIS